MIDGEKAVAVGRSAGELGLWHEQDVFVGNNASYRAIATTDNVFMGFNVGGSAASAARNVAIGSEALEDAYDAEVDTAHQLTSKTDYKMVGNTAQSQTLTKLRDTLLPQLIAGELRLSEAEPLTEEALV